MIYNDADCVGALDDRKSISGYLDL